MRPELESTEQRWKTQAPSASAAGPTRPADSIPAAMKEFCLAVASKKVEPICTSFQALRKAASGIRFQDLLHLADQAVGESSLKLIVSAFSHLSCLMCSNGTVSCEHCHGTGKFERDRLCPSCYGLGMEPCEFCRGTGWADRDLVPREIRSAVLDRQIHHVREDIQRLAKTLAGSTPEQIAAMDPAQRRGVVAWMLRLQARSEDLQGIGVLTEEGKLHLAAVAEKIQQCLDRVRRA